MKRTKSFLRVGLALLALSCLLFAGCSSGSDDDGLPPPSPVPTTMNNIQVYNLDGSLYAPAADVTFTQINPQDNGWVTLSSIGLSNIVVAQTTGIIATLTLGTPDDSVLGDWTIPGISISPSDVELFEVDKFRAGGGLDLKRIKDSNNEARLIYSTKAATLTGSAEYEPGETTTFSLNLATGWNWVLRKESGNNKIYTTGTPGADYKWCVE